LFILLRKYSDHQNWSEGNISIHTIPQCRLEDLRLDRINICEDGGKILGDALSVNTSLVSLSLRCEDNDMSIGDNGLKALAVGLSRNSHLKNSTYLKTQPLLLWDYALSSSTSDLRHVH